MSKSLADILGWEEGAIYKYGSIFFKIEHDTLLSSLTRELDVWYLDVPVSLNEITYLRKATKVEPKKYYLRHKFFGSPWGNYLNYRNTTNRLYLLDIQGTVDYKTQFTQEEIEEIEASGFDLCNFEKVEVENEKN